MGELFFALWSGVGGIVLNTAVGIATGVVSGLAVARASRFSQIKQQLHRHMRNWEYIGNEQCYRIHKNIDWEEMFDSASELAYLGHPTASLHVRKALREIQAHQQVPSPEGCTIVTLEALDRRLQQGFRELSPNWRAIILNGKL